MADKTVVYNFEANTSNFAAGMNNISKSLDQLAIKVNSTLAKLSTAAVGVSPAFTSIKNSADKLNTSFSTASQTFNTATNSMISNTNKLDLAVSLLTTKMIAAFNQLNSVMAKPVAVTASPLAPMANTASITAAQIVTALQPINTALIAIQNTVLGTSNTLAGMSATVTTGFAETLSSMSATKKPIEETKNAADDASVALTATGSAGAAAGMAIISGFNKVISTVKKLGTSVLSALGIAFSGNEFGTWIKASASYIETINMFRVAMGTVADSATDFLTTMSSTLGLDPALLMKIQGRFDLLAKSIGVATIKANTMSEGMTQLSVDLASLWDMDVAAVERKLESGIVGYSRAVRDLGIDVSLNAIQNEANIEQLNVNVRTLDQASKMQLRYNAILRQTTAAQGDFARTAEQPANQFRILREQIEITTRTIGAIFLPIIARIVPTIIAIIQIIGDFAQALATLMGFGDYVAMAVSSAAKAQENIKLLGDDYDNLGESADIAGNKMADIQGFDELNKLGGANSGSNNLGSNLNIDIPIASYDMGLSNVMLKATAIKEQILGWWSSFKGSTVVVGFINAITIAWSGARIAIEWVIEQYTKLIGLFNKNGSNVLLLGWSKLMIFIKPIIDTIVQSFVGLWNSLAKLGPTFVSIWTGLKNLWSSIKPIVDLIATNIGIGLVTSFATIVIAFNVLVAAIGPIVNTIVSNINMFIDVVTLIVQVLTLDFSGASKTFGKLLVDTSTYIINFKSIFTGVFGGLWNSIVAVLNTFGTNIKTFFGNIWTTITTKVSLFISGVIKFFTNLPQNIGYALGFVIGKLILWVTNMIVWAAINIPKFIQSVVQFFATLPIKILVWFTSTMTNIINWFLLAPAKIALSAAAFINNIIDWFRNLPVNLYNLGQSILAGLWNGILNSKNWLFGKITGFFGGFIDGVRSAFGIRSPSTEFMSIGEYMIEGMAIGITSSAKLLTRAYDSLPSFNTQASYSLATEYGSIGTLPRTSFDNKSTASTALTEENVFKAVSRALLGMPPPVVNMDSEKVSKAVNTANSDMDRRYGKW